MSVFDEDCLVNANQSRTCYPDDEGCLIQYNNYGTGYRSCASNRNKCDELAAIPGYAGMIFKCEFCEGDLCNDNIIPRADQLELWKVKPAKMKSRTKSPVSGFTVFTRRMHF